MSNNNLVLYLVYSLLETIITDPGKGLFVFTIAFALLIAIISILALWAIILLIRRPPKS